jgi:hypothetical protein
MLLDEMFIAADLTHSSITVLFFFVTPPLILLNHLLLRRYGNHVLTKDIADLTNFYQVEIKIRLLIR